MVLVHAGASGVGSAAIQLVRLFGAVPVVTAGSPEKLKMAEGLGAATGFNYKEGGFAQRVHDFTAGEIRKITNTTFHMYISPKCVSRSVVAENVRKVPLNNLFLGISQVKERM